MRVGDAGPHHSAAERPSSERNADLQRKDEGRMREKRDLCDEDVINGFISSSGFVFPFHSHTSSCPFLCVFS